MLLKARKTHLARFQKAKFLDSARLSLPCHYHHTSSHWLPPYSCPLFSSVCQVRTTGGSVRNCLKDISGTCRKFFKWLGSQVYKTTFGDISVQFLNMLPSEFSLSISSSSVRMPLFGPYLMSSFFLLQVDAPIVWGQWLAPAVIAVTGRLSTAAIFKKIRGSFR